MHNPTNKYLKTFVCQTSTLEFIRRNSVVGYFYRNKTVSV